MREAVLNSIISISLPVLAPRRLSYQCTIANEGITSSRAKWIDAEVEALIEFILFHSSGDTWPSHKQMMFWTNAGEFVKIRSGSDTYRSGMPVVSQIYVCLVYLFAGSACRYKVVGCLKKQFKTPRDAENAYPGERRSDSRRSDSRGSDSRRSDSITMMEPSAIEYHFNQLSITIQLDLLSRLFSSYASRELKLSVPDDFVVLAARAMVQLKTQSQQSCERQCSDASKYDTMKVCICMICEIKLLYNILFYQRR